MAPEKDRTNRKDERSKDENRDPISGAPGAHPLGAGVGAAAGGIAGGAGAAAAGAATGTAIGGPAGTVAGAAVGAIAGGLIGKGVAEKVNPTAEDAYWREQHKREPYYDKTYSYEDYQGAYRTGYEGYGRWGGRGRSYDEIEPELEKEYERNKGKSRLSWQQARHATRAAWHRFDRDLSQYVGYDVIDRSNDKIGTLECLWSDHAGEPAFVGVKTGWIFGKTHVVPAESVQVNEREKRIRLPYDKQKVKDAPAYDGDAEMDEAREWEIRQYYGLGGKLQQHRDLGAADTRTRQIGAAAKPAETTGMRRSTEERSMQLSEEQVKIGKREVEAGGVRLRKVVRVETVNQPVELRREEIVIERVPAGEAQIAARGDFSGEELYIPLRREEAVIQKDAHVREEVRVRKESHTDQQRISEEVRREDVEIEETGEARRGRRTPAEEIREREEIPRSQRQRGT